MFRLSNQERFLTSFGMTGETVYAQTARVMQGVIYQTFAIFSSP